MTKKELKEKQKRIKEIKAEIKDLTKTFKSGEIWLDGVAMLENEYCDFIADLEDELEDLENELEDLTN